MKTDNFQLSKDFNQRVMKAIKQEYIIQLKEVKQLWRFSLLTVASAAILAIVFMVHSSQPEWSVNEDLTANLNEFELTIDYWTNN